MASVNTDSISVDLTGVTSVRMKVSLWSLLPRAVGALTFVFSLYAVAYFGGVLIGVLDDKVSTWTWIWSVVMSIVVIVLALGLAGAAAAIVITDDVSGQARGTISWLLLFAAVLSLIGAAFSYNTVMKVQETGGAFGENREARIEYIRQNTNSAGMQVGFAVAMGCAFLSLGLIGRKDVLLSRGNHVEKIRNVSFEDAIRIRNSVAQQA